MILTSELNQEVFHLTLALLLIQLTTRAFLFKLKLMGVGGPIFNIFKDLLTNHQQCVSVD